MAEQRIVGTLEQNCPSLHITRHINFWLNFHDIFLPTNIFPPFSLFLSTKIFPPFSHCLRWCGHLGGLQPTKSWKTWWTWLTRSTCNLTGRWQDGDPGDDHQDSDHQDRHPDDLPVQWKALLSCNLTDQDGDGDISFNEFVWLMTRWVRSHTIWDQWSWSWLMTKFILDCVCKVLMVVLGLFWNGYIAIQAWWMKVLSQRC